MKPHTHLGRPNFIINRLHNFANNKSSWIHGECVDMTLSV